MPATINLQLVSGATTRELCIDGLFCHHIPTLEQLASQIESAVDRTVRPRRTALPKIGGQLYSALQWVHHYSKGWARRAGCALQAD